MSENEEHILEKKNLVIEMVPWIAEIFKHSKNVSGVVVFFKLVLVEKGKSHKLMRKALINDNRDSKRHEEEKVKDAIDSIQNIHDEIDRLKEELEQKDKELNEREEQRRMLVRLLESGVINDRGELIDKDEINNDQ